MARLDPSIRHAISPPKFGEDKLHRAKLVDRLHGELPKKLIAIAAPAGYGKTTLLSDFVAHSDLPIVWGRSTEADQDLMRFAGMLYEAFEKRFRRLRGTFDLQTYAGSEPQSLAFGFVNLLDEHIPENFVLILDDVHHLQASDEVMSFLDTLILNLPDQITVIACGREVLEISLAQLMAEDDLAGFGPHDLALTWNETAKLLGKLTGQELPPFEISQVQEYTRGWVTGVVLSEHSATQATLEAGISESLIYEYLSSVVINRQPEQLRRFMLDSSVLPIMTADACNVVLDRKDAEEMLEELVGRNLFITASGHEQQTYEYHPIFRAQLAEAAKASDSALYRDLRTKAAEYLKVESPEISFALFLELGNREQAVDIAEMLAADLHANGRYSTIARWHEMLQDFSCTSPSLQYYYALILLNRGSINEAIEVFDRILVSDSPIEIKANALLEKGRTLLRQGRIAPVDDVLNEIENLIPRVDEISVLAREIRFRAAILSRIEKKHPEAALLLNEAIALLEGEEHRGLLLNVLQDQTYYFGIAGNLAGARKAAALSLQIARDYSSPMRQIASYINMGQLEYLDGDFDNALHTLKTAKSISSKTASADREAEVLFYQADIFNDVGLLIQAAELYQEGLSIASSKDLKPLLMYGSLGVCSLQRRAGNHKLANEWLKRAVEFGRNGQTISQINQKAAIILASNPSEAINMLSDEDAIEVDSIAAPDRALREYFLARANFADGRIQKSIERFKECLAICSLLGTDQYIAAELYADDEFYNQISEYLSNDPLLHSINNQMSLIKAFQSHYSSANEEVDKSGLVVKALGEATILWNGEQLDNLKPQAMELLLMLVDMGSVERDVLIEEFWPDHPSGRQTGNLHMAVYSIRRAIGKDNILLNGSTYELDPNISLIYDVAEFERAIDVSQSLPPGDPRSFFALTEANNKYGGAFLPDYYSDWIEDRRRQLEIKFLDIASEYADASIQKDQPSKALASLRNALNIDPYRDDLNYKYLEALLKLGRRSDVISHYISYREMLEEDLGLKPAKNIVEMHERAIGSA